MIKTNFKARIPARLMASLSCGVAFATAVPALAQTGPEPAPATGAQSGGIDDIIVTARKRQESILNVPVIETAISQERIEQHGILSVSDLPTQVSGLVMGNSTSGFGQQVSIHGIGNTTQSATVDQTVALNIDGVQINAGLAYQAGLYDVAQVEVLKGPQALFFGKNSPGGVISLRSADPGDHLEAMIRGGYEFEARQRRLEGFVSGPVTDTLGLRLAASVNDQDGFFYNNAKPSAVPGGFIGGIDPRSDRYAPQTDVIIRGTALWKPFSGLSARLKVNYALNDTRGAGGEYQLGNCPNGLASAGGFPVPFLAGAECRLDRTITVSALDPRAFLEVENGGRPFSKNEQYFGSLELNYDVAPHVTLTSVTGYYNLTHRHLADGSNTTIPSLAAFEYLNRRDFTEELRLASDYAGRLNFTLGGFYQNGFVHDQYHVGANTAIGFPIPVLEDGYSEVRIESVSGFAQGRFAILPNLDLTGGLRYTHERRSQQTYLNRFDYFSFCCGDPATFTPGFLALPVPRIRSSNVSREVNLTFHPTSATTLFATYKQGFKSGSFNTGPSYSNADQSYGDEQVQAVEAGFKGRFFDRQLAVNLFGYYYDYKNLQVGALAKGALGDFGYRTLNAATAEIKGLDFDVTFKPQAIAGLSLNFAVNYNHGRFGTFDNAPCWSGQTIALGCDGNLNTATGLYTTQNLSGRPLVRSPDWSGTFGFDYERDLAHGMKLTFGSSTYFTSDFYIAPLITDTVIQRGFLKTNANVALSGNGGGWEIALIGTNLANTITAGDASIANVTGAALFVPNQNGGTTSGPGGLGQTLLRAETGRAVWVRLTARFGAR